MTNIAQIKAREQANKKKFLALNPNIPDKSGIYILHREENGIKHAYIGQAHRILTRLSQHLSGYQYIDISVKKHGLYGKDNPFGYQVAFECCPETYLDEREKHWIKTLANKGFQLKNRSIGGQGEGKFGLDNQKPSRNYHDGLAQGRKSLAKQLKHIIDTHLEVRVRKENKITQKALGKFWELLEIEDKE